LAGTCSISFSALWILTSEAQNFSCYDDLKSQALGGHFKTGAVCVDAVAAMRSFEEQCNYYAPQF